MSTMTICDDKSCTGCMACVGICPVDAIGISSDERGFYRPVIQENACIHCNRCRRICPSLNPSHGNQVVWTVACWQPDQALRRDSTSGGAFTALADYVFAQGGTVFGAAFSDDLRVEHVEIFSREDMWRLRGSKYVQSYMGTVYRTVEQRLRDNRYVLFSGTPCQVAGLKAFLGKTYDRLLTVDIICHGVPSPLFFADYLEHIRQEYSPLINRINFRYKKPSWTKFSMKIEFADREPYLSDKFTDPYLIAFLYDYISQDCCHHCPYTSTARQGDITLADFWGYVSQKYKYRNDEKGISLVLINSKAGLNVFEQVSPRLICVDKKIEEAISGNRCLSSPYPQNKNTEAFWREYLGEKNGYDAVKSRYLYKRKAGIKHDISVAVDNFSWLIPHAIRSMYDRFKGKIK